MAADDPDATVPERPGRERALGAGAERAKQRARLASSGRYDVRGLLGEGGMGVVFEAWDDVLRRDVALKVVSEELMNSDSARERFLVEARAAAAIEHPNLVRIHDVEPHELILVMEIVRGDSLAHRLKRDGRFEVAEARRILGDVLDGLGAVHDAGVIHRDLKPANVLITEEGVAKITDFGVAKVADSDLTATGERIGTPAYMAPEQLRAVGEVDVRIDVYALGLIFYEMLTGERYHTAGDRRGPAERVAAVDVPAWVGDFLVKSLAEDPDERFASAAEMRAALEEARLVPPAPRRRWLLPAVGLVGLTLAVAIFTASLLNDDTDAPVPALTSPEEVPPTDEPLPLPTPVAPGRLRDAIDAFYALDLATADASLEAITAAAPEDATASYYLALARAFGLASPDDARRAREAAQALEQVPPRDAILEAAAGFEQGELERAAAALVEPVREHPDHWELQYAAGEVHSHRGEHDAASLSYGVAHDRAPHFLPPVHHAMDLALVRGDDAAARSWLAALEEHAHSGEVSAGYSVRWAIGRGDFDGALQLAPRDPPTLTRVFALAAAGRFDDAEEAALLVRPFQRGTRQVPDGLPLAALAWARNDRAAWERWLAIGREQTLRHTTSLHAANREYRIGIALLIANEIDAAVESLERSRERLAPAFPAPLGLAFGLLAWRRGDAEELARVRSRLDDVPDAYYLAEVLAALDALALDLAGSRAEAIARAQRGIEEAGSPSVLVDLAWIVATLARQVGDDDALASACEHIRRPLVFDREWLYTLDACASE